MAPIRKTGCRLEGSANYIPRCQCCERDNCALGCCLIIDFLL